MATSASEVTGQVQLPVPFHKGQQHHPHRAPAVDLHSGPCLAFAPCHFLLPVLLVAGGGGLRSYQSRPFLGRGRRRQVLTVTERNNDLDPIHATGDFLAVSYNTWLLHFCPWGQKGSSPEQQEPCKVRSLCLQNGREQPFNC